MASEIDNMIRLSSEDGHIRLSAALARFGNGLETPHLRNSPAKAIRAFLKFPAFAGSDSRRCRAMKDFQHGTTGVSSPTKTARSAMRRIRPSSDVFRCLCKFSLGEGCFKRLKRRYDRRCMRSEKTAGFASCELTTEDPQLAFMKPSGLFATSNRREAAAQKHHSPEGNLHAARAASPYPCPYS